MQKIPTIFDRDWDGNRGVVDKISDDVKDFPFREAIVTEKLDGTNVRLTVRNHQLVRLEKRRNPSKLEKAKGIVDPWYVDASFGSEDKWIYDATDNTDLSQIEDGEWSGEAVGPNIQGNPLNLESNRVVLFSNPHDLHKLIRPSQDGTKLVMLPIFSAVKEYLTRARSVYGNDCGIEGLVLHAPDGRMAKIKLKDFK